MTETDVKRVAALIRAREQIVEWWDDTLAKDQRDAEYPLVRFGDIGVVSEGGNGSGWGGDLTLPREAVAAMFAGAKRYIQRVLTEMHIDPDPTNDKTAAEPEGPAAA